MRTTHLSQRALPRRGLVVAVVLTLVFVGLLTQPAIPLSAQTDATPDAYDGIALWANATQGSGGLVWSASSSSAEGLVHSNRDLTINGSNNLLLGGTEYVRRLRVTGRKNVIDPPATKVAPAEFPITFDIADYRPGGVVALAAGVQYYDGTTECELYGTWKRDVHGTEIITGLHYVPCDVIISAADTTGSFTIVSEGSIQVTAARVTLGPAFTDDLLLFSNAGTNNAILIAGEDSAFDGFVYTPLGSAMLAGANHYMRCGILANEIAVTGWGHRFIGDPTCGNRSPVAIEDAYTTDEDVTLVVAAPGVLDNDSDADGDPLAASLVVNVSNGTLTLQVDGSFTYLPTPDFYGEDSFTYEACDTGTPPLCDSASVAITVNGVNDTPVADPNGPYSGLVGSGVSFDGLGSSDVDGTIVSYDWQFGDWTTGSGATPSYTYAETGLYTVSLTVTDDGGLTDTDTTTADIAEAPNAPPVAIEDAYTTDEDVTLVVAAPGVLSNDTDADNDPLTASLVADVSNGILTLQADGSFTYLSNLNFYGEDSFTYVANDGKVDSNIATVTISVSPVNDAPVPVDDGYVTDEDVILSVAAPGVLGNDSDVDGDPLTAVLVADASHGTLTLNPDGSFSYISNPNFNGTDSFTYVANDGKADSNIATVTFTVSPVNDAPVAVDNGYVTDEDVFLVVAAPGVFDNDSDPDVDPLAASLVADVSNGTLTLNPDGSFSYMPDLNFNGTDSFTYGACDTGTPPLCDSALVTITVNAVNDPPVADPNGPYSGSVGSVVSFDGSDSSDVDGTIVSYKWDFGDGTIGSGAAPSHTYAAVGPYTVSLTVTDDDGLTGTASTTVDIAEAPNTAPVAVIDAYATDEDVIVSVEAPGVLGNDSDADGDPLAASMVVDVSNGTLTLQADGSFSYMPSLNFNGTDSFTYEACDTGTPPLCDSVSVAITINPVNDPPMADAGQDQTVTVGDLVILDGSGSSDPDKGDPLTFLWVFLVRPDGSAATLTGASSASPTFIPDLPGDYIVELTVDDGNSGTATDTLSVSADPIGMTISLVDTLVGVGRTTNGTIILDNPAPPGGIIVTLSLDTVVATIDPIEVPITESTTEGSFVLTGIGVGTTTITGISPVVETATANVQVTDSLISIDNIPVIAPEESADLPVSITKPAPGGGLTITLESLDPTIAVTDPTVFIPEGMYIPTSNPQITGVAFGTTQIKATALAFGPDMREVTVALQVTLSPAELDLPELWTLHITAKLSAPAPSGGVTLELWLDDPTLATVPAIVFIPAGQTLSGSIDITAGSTLGTTILHAGGSGLIEGTMVINIIDTPDVYLEGDQNVGGGIFYQQPFVVGVDLQFRARVRFEVSLPGPVDVIVSAPAGSGVLFSLSPTGAGSESLVVETGFTSSSSSPYTRYFYIQGTIQGDDVLDNVPVTIEVFETGTTVPVGFEQADRPSEVDIGPSGFQFLTGADLDAPTFPNTDVEVWSYVLYDGESGTLHNRRYTQQTRGGHTITVDLTNSNPLAGTVVAPAVFTGGDYHAYAEFDGLTAGTTALGIIQPAGFTAPANGYTTRNVNVDAPNLYLQRYVSGWQPSPDENIGRDLQVERRIGLEVAPPAPGVDVTIEVVDPSVALISTDPSAIGSASITFPLVTGTYTPLIYMQGLTLGQGTELRITAPGYDQWITTIQVVKAGFYISTPGNFATTTGAANRTVSIRPASLDALQRVDENQQVRGGSSFAVDVVSSNNSVGVITISPLVFTGIDDYRNTAFDPIAVGTTTISITQPAGFNPPVGKTSIVATVNP